MTKHIGCSILAAELLANKCGSVIIVAGDENNDVTAIVQKPFIITRLPKIDTPWIDPKEPVFNYRKHKQTCEKNRKKRKKRKN